MLPKTNENQDGRYRNAHITGLTLAFLGAALFACKGIIVKFGHAAELDSITMLTWRMIISVPIFAIVGYLGYRKNQAKNGSKPLNRAMVLKASAIGILGYYLASFLDFSSLEHISAQLNRLILLTYPFLVLIFGALFFGKKLKPIAVIAALCSYAGIAVIFGYELKIEGDQVWLGAMLVLSSSIVYAFYQLFAKGVIDSLGSALFTSIAMSVAGVVVLIHFLITQDWQHLLLNPEQTKLMLLLAVFATIIPAYATSAAIGLIGPEKTAIFGNISPLITILFAVLLLGEHFTIMHLLGTSLVFFGILVFTRQGR